MTAAASTDMVKAYLARVYTPLSKGGWIEYPDGALIVGLDGRIVAIGEREEILARFSQVEIEDHRGKLIVPGLVDCHQHLCHYAWVRLIPDLIEWLERIYALESRFEDTEHAWRISRLFFRDLARNGTTTCCVHGPYFEIATDIAFRTAEESGLRILMGMNTGDEDLPYPLITDARTTIQKSIALCSRWDGAANGRLSYCFTVRPAYCASDALLRGMAEAARRCNARIQSHLGESEDGARRILARFPDCPSEVMVYDTRDILGPRTIMAHGVFLSDEDLELLAKRGVAIAHCPRANLLTSGKQMNTEKIRAAGISIGLGSDLGAGKGLNLWRSIEDAIKVNLHFSIHEAFRLATIEGAQALGMGTRTGSLERGREADFLVLSLDSLSELGLIEMADTEDILASLVFRGDDRHIEKVVVAGRVILSSGRRD